MGAQKAPTNHEAACSHSSIQPLKWLLGCPGPGNPQSGLGIGRADFLALGAFVRLTEPKDAPHPCRLGNRRYAPPRLASQLCEALSHNLASVGPTPAGWETGGTPLPGLHRHSATQVAARGVPPAAFSHSSDGFGPAAKKSAHADSQPCSGHRPTRRAGFLAACPSRRMYSPHAWNNALM